MTPPLACTVRGCHGALERCGPSYRCPRGHSYDVARHGYVNLLQPQDRRSLRPGDSREQVQARAALLAAGVGRGVVNALADRATSLLPHRNPLRIVELGSGSGETLGQISDRRTIVAAGVDLSVAAAAHAARSYPAITWVVANADRYVPMLDSSIDLVLSVHARRNPAECRRVLTAEGFLLIAIPAPDDLIELRTALQGTGVEHDRVPSTIARHEAHFSVVDRFSTREVHELDRSAIAKLLKGTYRGERVSESARVAALETMRMTFASDVILFAAR